MTNQEREYFDSHTRKLDLILQVLQGDELGHSKGLIAEQQEDNEFRVFVKEKLNKITDNQNHQIKINERVSERLDAIEVFVSFFATLSKLKKTTWVVLGSIMAGMGWLASHFEKVLKWLEKSFG